jgi:hypothetical protein
MRGKLLLVVGLGVGYVLGAKAGRERYNDIKRAAERFWGNPTVQHQVKNAEEYAKDKAPEVVEFLSDGAKKVASQVSGKAKTVPAKTRAVASKAATAASSAASSATGE